MEDSRGPERRAQDDRIAAEPPLSPPDLPPDATPEPVEAHLSRQIRRPLAVAGIVENGLVRPLDANVKLPEHARVIIVTSEQPSKVSRVRLDAPSWTAAASTPLSLYGLR